MSEENEQETVAISVVLGNILQMMQYFTNLMNQEALKILHNAQYCNVYLEKGNCPLCLNEEVGEEE